MKTIIAVAALGVTCAVDAAEFVNLKFDEPDMIRLALDPKTGGTSASVVEMIPGWEISLREVADGWKQYTGLVELSGAVGVSPVALSTGYAYESSGFGVSMQAAPAIGFPAGPRPPDVRISTKGTVPRSATFFEWSGGWGLEVMVGDGSRQVTAPGKAGILNVSQFAGSEVVIRFELRSGGSEGFDVIGFTQTATDGDLSPPSKLTHTVSSKESVTLTWAPSTDGVLGYEVFSSPNRETAFTNRISGKLITETTYTYSSDDVTGRFYKVRAVAISTKSGAAVTKYSLGAICEVP